MDKGGLIKKYFDEGLVLYGVGKFEEADRCFKKADEILNQNL